MRGYGLPRLIGVDFPDKGDIREFGLKTECFGEKVPSVKKRAARRYWKKCERANSKIAIRNALVAQLAEATV